MSVIEFLKADWGIQWYTSAFMLDSISLDYRLTAICNKIF